MLLQHVCSLCGCPLTQLLAPAFPAVQMLPEVPWFNERILTNISLGSLTLVLLLRTVSHNVAKLQDDFLHRTCFSALANMAPHCEHLHSYAAQRIVATIHLLVRKHRRIADKLGRVKAQHAELAAKSPLPGNACPCERHTQANSNCVFVSLPLICHCRPSLALSLSLLSPAGTSAANDVEVLLLMADQLEERMAILDGLVLNMINLVQDCLANRVLPHNLNLVRCHNTTPCL